jgi:hypothetical protein
MKSSSVIVLALVIAGCATHGSRASSESAAPSRDSELLTEDEFSGVKGSTLYDAVQELRPTWILRGRPNPLLQSHGDIIIYIDGARYGAGIDGLRTIPIRAVASARYFSPSGATVRFGPGHLLGAIEVITIPN